MLGHERMLVQSLPNAISCLFMRRNIKKYWYQDKQNLALLAGFLSTVVTFLNFIVSVAK